MKKILLKLCCIAFAVAFSVVAFAGCGGIQRQKKAESLEGVIDIELFDGGYKTAWLDDIIKAYKKINPKASVIVTPTVNTPSSAALISAERSSMDIVMVNANHFTSALEGKLYDLSENYEYTPPGESKKVSEKISPNLLEFYNQDGKYYHLPWANAVVSLVYNETAMDEALGKGAWSLPRTTDELLELSKRLKSAGVYAFTFSVNNGQNYMDTYLVPAWMAQYMGVEEFRKHSAGYYRNAEGNYEFATVGKQDQLLENVGKLKAMEVLYNLIRKSNGYAHQFAGDMNFMQMQQTFCGWGYGSDKKAVAMTAGGDWLESEVAFMLEDRPQTIKMMKVPVISSIVERLEDKTMSDETLCAVIDYVDGKTTAAPANVSEKDIARIREARSSYTSLSFIHTAVIPQTSQNKTLAVDFLKFMVSDQAQMIFSQALNGVTMPYGFDPKNKPTIKMSEFQQSVVENFVVENANPITYADASSKLNLFGAFTPYHDCSREFFFETDTPKGQYDYWNQYYSERWSDILRISGLAQNN